MAEHSGTLDTVQDYITDTRTLLQDTVAPYRYDDASLLVALNSSLLEARRLRADLFVFQHGNRVPSYSSVSDEDVPIEPPFRLAFVYGTVAHALMRDQEDIEDVRATSFMNAFNSILTGSVAVSLTAPPGPGAPARRA